MIESLFEFPPNLSPMESLAVDDESDSTLTTPLLGDDEPLLWDHNIISRTNSGNCKVYEARGEQKRAEIVNISQWHAVNASASKPKLYARSRHHNPSVTSADNRVTSFRISYQNNSSHSRGTTPQKIPKFVFPTTHRVRRLIRRSASSPGPEPTKPDNHDPNIDSATLQQRLITRTKHSGSPPFGPWRVRRVRTAIGPFQWTSPRSPSRPGFMWFPARSESDPSCTPQVTKHAIKSGNNTRLKTCMKHKSKSATTTPPNETLANPSKTQKLRRIKTVDFLPPLKSLTFNLSPVATENVGETKACRGTSSVKKTKVDPQVPSYPGPMTKIVPADPAVTRTNVHVVSIAPSWSIDDVPDEGGSSIDSATPTMQIIESKSGSYEVIWDDVPPEHDIQAHRRGSSASQALSAASPDASRGLQRVNTKLTEWSFGKGNSSGLFKPQIVVFPDVDDRASQCPMYECAVEDDEDFAIIAPPNTSTNPSRRHSRPGSARISKADSDTDDEATSDKFPEKTFTDDLYVTPSPEARPSRPGHIAAHRSIRKPPSLRRLSNMDESDMKFRRHRDSVALARSRMLNAGGVSPELFVPRDSVSIAKKRVSHHRNHAISSARDIPQPKVGASYMDQSTPTSPAEAPATTKLEGNDTMSMFTPQSASVHPHIRIVE